MNARLGAVVVFSALVVSLTAQDLRFPPLPPPRFSATIEYVEVDARVLDQQRRPVRDLKQEDFTVLEDGVPQDVSVFSVVDIPIPPPAQMTAARAQTAGVKPDVATNNHQATDGRVYLIVVDDFSISPRRTVRVRKLLREFIEKSVGPSDFVGFSNTGRSPTYLNFTNDKARLLATVDTIVGQSPGSPTALGATTLAAGIAVRDTETFEMREGQRMLASFIQGMAGVVDSRSKAIIYVTEGMVIDTVTNTEGMSLLADMDRVTSLARRGNVPIYPVDPRGLSSGFDDAIDIPGVQLDQQPESAIKDETMRSQQRLIRLADDTGGTAVTNANDLAGGLDRIVSQSSFYYVLGYYAKNPKRDGKFHRTEVKVNRPGLTVLARHGYTAASAKGKRPSLAGPPATSYELRETLNSALPVAGLPMATTAAAFRHSDGKSSSVAVVVETGGAELAWMKNGALELPIEMTAVALEKRGEIRQGEVGKVQFPLRTEVSERVRQFGFRWLARLDDLKPGRYQVRAVAANGPSAQGSVWYDIEIPDFSKAPLAMSDVLLASVVAMQRPTLRPDKTLADALPGPPTTLREFPAVDTIAVYAEVYDNDLSREHDIESTILVANERGEQVFKTVATQTSRQLAESHGILRVRLKIPLINVPPGRYTLSVDARQAANRSISAGRAVPFQVVVPASAGNK